FPHSWFFDIFYSNTTNHASNQSPRRIQLRSLSKKVLKVYLFFQLRLQLFLAITCQPTNNFINFCPRTAFFFSLSNIMWIDTCDARCIYSMVVVVHDTPFFLWFPLS